MTTCAPYRIFTSCRRSVTVLANTSTICSIRSKRSGLLCPFAAAICVLFSVLCPGHVESKIHVSRTGLFLPTLQLPIPDHRADLQLSQVRITPRSALLRLADAGANVEDTLAWTPHQQHSARSEWRLALSRDHPLSRQLRFGRDAP